MHSVLVSEQRLSISWLRIRFPSSAPFYAPVAQAKYCSCVRSDLLGRPERSILMDRSVG